MGSTVTAEYLSQSLRGLKGVGPRVFSALKELGLSTIEDLLYYFPKDYDLLEDLRPIANLQLDKIQRCEGVLQKITESEQSGYHILKGRLADAQSSIDILWFNQPYLKRVFKVGDRLRVRGKVQWSPYTQKSELRVQTANQVQVKKAGEIQPIYTGTFRIKSDQIKSWIQDALRLIQGKNRDFFDDGFRQRHGLISQYDAWKGIHFPDSIQAMKLAKQRFIFEEFFFHQIPYIQRKKQYQRLHRAKALTLRGNYAKQYCDALPYELTQWQKGALSEIETDLASGHQMNRLLQGDVGSGKTDVAILTLLSAIEAGQKAAFLVPTEILSVQHYLKCKDRLAAMNIQILLIKGGQSPKQREAIHEALQSETPLLIIGTHALIQDSVSIRNLGVLVIDEQHRFGVFQRLRLKNKGQYPHALYMTATPIPRSLCLSYYGDLDKSVIEGMPAGREPIQTYFCKFSRLKKVADFCRTEIEKGHQVYLVFALINETDKVHAKALLDNFEGYSEQYFSGLKTGILHGQMKTQEKAERMQAFKEKKVDVLFCTTVIEVGVDVPNANTIVILNAERFGLSQLHQLRGRVGRQPGAAHCFLVSDSKSKKTMGRLKAMLDSSNGFELSEADLKLRGPGEVLGTQQSGLPVFKLGNIQEDYPLLTAATDAAAEILEKDPQLTKHLRLKRELKKHRSPLVTELLN